MKVKDFVELVIGKIPYMPIVDNSAEYADLTKKEDLVDKFGEYEVIKVKFVYNNEPYIILHISNKDICASYRVRKVKLYLNDYEQGIYFGRYGVSKKYIEKDEPYCMGTRELESCNCDGDKSKCNFYRDIDKEDEKERD
jgi:hypothetical protein